MGIYLSKPNTTKHTQSGQTDSFTFAVSSIQGWRKAYEDAWIAIPNFTASVSLFAVFDGHGGPEVAQFCAKYFPQKLKENKNLQEQKFKVALEEAFIGMDELLLSEEGQKLLKELSKGRCTGLITGCTAVVALVTDTDVIIANAGDSKAILYTHSHQVTSLSQDHVPSVKSERERIKKAGGWVTEGRVNDNLNLTRAIGDLEYKHNPALPLKDQVITSFPDVEQVTKEGTHYLALGCDGFWEKFSAREIFERIDLGIGRRGQEAMVSILSGLLDDLLAKDTMEGTGCDNMTCLLVRFEKD